MDLNTLTLFNNLTDEDFAEATNMGGGKQLIETSDFTADDMADLSKMYAKSFESIRQSKIRKKKIKKINNKILRFSKSPLSTIKKVVLRSLYNIIN